MFFMTFFSENDDFVREIKIVPQGKQYSESETSSRKVKNAKFRTSYWKSRCETDSV
jgi:hypothetical protein